MDRARRRRDILLVRVGMVRMRHKEERHLVDLRMVVDLVRWPVRWKLVDGVRLS
jgi:hypothetical protein